MANSFEKYIGQSTDLDKVLCALMTSGVLETPEVQYVERGEFKIPVLEMDGLGNYDKATGFSSGNVSLTFDAFSLNQLEIKLNLISLFSLALTIVS